MLAQHHVKLAVFQLAPGVGQAGTLHHIAHAKVAQLRHQNGPRGWVGVNHQRIAGRQVVVT